MARTLHGVLSSAALGMFLMTACDDAKHVSSHKDAEADAADAVDSGTAMLPDASPDGTTAETLDPFDAWREIRSTLREADDHRLARAKALTEAGDAAQIFAFVRDEIITYPSSVDGFSDAIYAQRWGKKGALRGGAGTPREKAELLVWLYERAGLVAEVVRGRADPAKLDGTSVLLRAYAAPSALTFDEAKRARWDGALGDRKAIERTLIDPEGKAREALANDLLSRLPSDLQAPFDFSLSDIPLVRVQVEDAWVYANPIAPSAELGESLTLEEPTSTSPATAPEKVRVRLEGARADDPFTRFVMLEREYEADDVVGRKLNITFTPPAPVTTRLRMRARDVHTFIPMLTVAGPDMSQEERDALAEVGDLFTSEGDRYAIADDGTISVNGQPLGTESTDPAHLATVQNVGVDVQASSFPTITLRVSATDASGESVSNLGADAFTVSEDGKEVPFRLTQNLAPPPRVVLVFDISTSLPAEFVGAGATKIAEDISTALYAAHPDARIRMARVFYGADFVAGDWATDLTSAKAQAAAIPSGSVSSEIWEALYDAEALDPTLIVLVTDGDATDAPEPKFKTAIANGPPVVTLAAGSVVQDTVNAIETLSGGRTFPVSQQDEAVNAVTSMIDARSVQDYVLRYEAPVDGSAVRSVSVEVNGRRVDASYEVPSERSVPSALSGLYLTLRVGNREVTRALAGMARGYTTAGVDVTRAMLDDVRSVLLGRVTIAVEASAPSPSIVLDEWISDKLTLEPLMRALEQADDAKLLDALDQGFSLSPSKLPIAQPPLPQREQGDALTFEAGLRVAAFVKKARDGAPFTRQLDLFPLSRWATATDDARLAFEQTVRATSALAVMEAGLLNGPSTLEETADVNLTLLNPGQARDQDTLTAEQRLQWAMLEEPFDSQYQLLVPLAPGPFWAVHERSGSVIGILADGTGGAAETCGNYDAANNLIDDIALLGGLAGASVGGWAALAKWEVRMVTLATLVISQEASYADGDFTDPAAEMGCGMLDDALGEAFPPYGEYGTIVGMLEGAGLDTGAPGLCDGLSSGGTVESICGG